MKNIKNYALVAAMALTFAACGNNAAETTNDAATVDTEAATPSVGEGKAPGYGGDINVTVHFGEDGVIESIETVHTETEEIGGPAVVELEKAVVDANGTEGVDNVSGATVTSEAFKAAVEDAISNAK